MDKLPKEMLLQIIEKLRPKYSFEFIKEVNGFGGIVPKLAIFLEEGSDRTEISRVLVRMEGNFPIIRDILKCQQITEEHIAKAKQVFNSDKEEMEKDFWIAEYLGGICLGVRKIKEKLFIILTTAWTNGKWSNSSIYLQLPIEKCDIPSLLTALDGMEQIKKKERNVGIGYIYDD